MNFSIISNQIGCGSLGKVYLIKEIGSQNNILIAKIFDAEYLAQYNNEKEILDSLSSNDVHNNYIIKIKNININLEGDIPYNNHFIIFDYLKNGNLSKYLIKMDLYTPIPQDYVKLICFKLLKALNVIHNNDISHNKMDLNNIIFDNDFNPIVIHFSEAKRNNNGNFIDDFKGLGKILAKLMTNGKFQNYEFYKKKKCYVIIDNAKKMYNAKNYWKFYGNNENIVIPQEFIDLFNILMSNKPINIDDLINSQWLYSIVSNTKQFKIIENNCKKYFYNRYNNILEFEKQYREEINDINSMINTTNNNLFNFSSLLDSCRSIDTSKINDISKLKIKEINNEVNGILFDYIEIIINLDDYRDISSIFYNYMLKLEEIIQNLDKTKINIEYDEKYLSFTINIKMEEKNNYEIMDDEINNEEKQDYNNINNNNIINDDNFIYEDENNENENLEIKVELLKCCQKTDCFVEKYYLMFNCVEGEICDYYHYLKIFLEKAKKLLKSKCFISE